MLIDVHAHALSPAVVSRMVDVADFGWNLQLIGRESYRYAGGPELDPLIYDIELRLARIERDRVTLQLVSPPPSVISNGSTAIGVEASRLYNESTAWLVAHGEGRIAGLAVAALGDPAAAADELRRAVERHGFVGVVLSTSAGAVPLDAPVFRSLFATIESLDLLIFLHPTTSAPWATQNDYTLRTLVAWPTETTIAVARLIFAGALERHPALKIVLAHGGGTLAALAGRLDLGWSAPRFEANPACRANIAQKPSAYLKRLYYDTVVADPHVLDLLIRTYSADHVVFGTDFPYEIGDADGGLALPTIERLPTADRDKVKSDNALRLLGSRAPPTIG